MKPLKPNNIKIEMALTNGGEMTGKIKKMCSSFFSRNIGAGQGKGAEIADDHADNAGRYSHQ